MNPATFREANCKFGPPSDLDVSQCQSIDAFSGTILGGNLDGSKAVVVAWKPTDDEIEQMRTGGLIYLTMIGGLSPHSLSTNFQVATSL